MGEGHGFEELKKRVIDPGFCTLCGVCSAFCSKIVIQDKPVLCGSCACNGLGKRICYTHCPMVAAFDPKHIHGRAKKNGLLGEYSELKAARALDQDVLKGAQDGGAVTSILKMALENRDADAVIVVGRDSEWRPVARLITDPSVLLETAGSKYAPAPSAELLGEAFRRKEISKVIVVGLPCHVRGIRNLEYGLLYNAGFSASSDLKIITIGLFCSGAFSRDGLFGRLGFDPRRIKKIAVKGNAMTVIADTTKSFALSELKEEMLRSCGICGDYTAELADISVGSIGTSDGWSTVILRTAVGISIFNKAVDRGYVEARDTVDEGGLAKIVARKKEGARRRTEAVKKRGSALPPICAR